MKIDSIQFVEGEDERKVMISIGKELVHITPCDNSYKQWGASLSAIKETQPLAQFFLPWLQGNMSLQDFIESKNIE